MDGEGLRHVRHIDGVAPASDFCHRLGEKNDRRPGEAREVLTKGPRSPSFTPLRIARGTRVTRKRSRTVASSTKVYKVRKRIKRRKMGRKRKNELARKGTTPPLAVFFGDETRETEGR